MHPDDLPSAHRDEQATQATVKPVKSSWDQAYRSVGLDVIYDQAMINNGTYHPILLSGEFKLVGNTWTDCLPRFLICRDTKEIYPFHSVISLHIKEDRDDT